MTSTSFITYLLAGDAVFILRSKRTGADFVLRVLRRDVDHIVSMGQLVKHQDSRGFVCHADLGRIVNDRLYLTPVPAEHTKAQATLSWFWPRALMDPGSVLAQCDVIPDEFCASCGHRAPEQRGLCASCVKARQHVATPQDKFQAKCYDTPLAHYALPAEVEQVPDAFLLAMGDITVGDTVVGDVGQKHLHDRTGGHASRENAP